MLPSTIPIFPMPNVVLFPAVFLPLHIFEARYRQMLSDALRGDRIIGISLLKRQKPNDDAPAVVYPIGCAGLISHAEELPNGRSNIVLRGIQRFRIGWEEHERTYRRAHIEPLPEKASEAIRTNVHETRTQLETLLAGRLETLDGPSMVPGGMGDEDLVNTLSQYLDLEPVEKQALLERDDIASRSQALIDLIQIRTLATSSSGGSGLQ
ncbi:uncharacterized protein METZ01_LOCUS144422 [marine metagenome]|uniref:Lon N-terminal domain-containing protein n=1 Tax=marine metagenome TaxID=408172 RepID=A0A381ZQK4_9ZZZZ